MRMARSTLMMGWRIMPRVSHVLSHLDEAVVGAETPLTRRPGARRQDAGNVRGHDWGEVRYLEWSMAQEG